MIWSGVYFVITPGHFGAFILPLKPHKTSDQYPLKFIYSPRSLTGTSTDLEIYHFGRCVPVSAHPYTFV
jgi:hypothetical protein